MDIFTTIVAVTNNNLIKKNKNLKRIRRSEWQKALCFFQISMKSLSPKGGCVIDLICSTRGSLLASRACNSHLLAFQGDQEIFDIELKPIFDNAPKYYVEGFQIRVANDNAFIKLIKKSRFVHFFGLHNFFLQSYYLSSLATICRSNGNTYG